jgi:hypothetical protein
VNVNIERALALSLLLAPACDGEAAGPPGADAGAMDPDAAAATDAGPPPSDASAAELATVDTAITYGAGREVGLRVHYSTGVGGPHWIVLISHGGLGMESGETRFDHLGVPIAEHGGVAVQLGHRSSSDRATHRLDRPRDVTAAIDALADGRVALPGLVGDLNTSAVGHTGHSAGAYTSHAVAGAQYPYDPEADPRIAAIAPISPQGTGDFFVAYDNGPDDDTWGTVDVPVLTLVGGAELDTNGLGRFVADDWRLQPFERYPDDADRIRILVPEQDHNEMGSLGAPPIQAYLGEAVATFFAAVLGDAGDLCSVGVERVPDGLTPTVEARPGAVSTRLARCR